MKRRTTYIVPSESSSAVEDDFLKPSKISLMIRKLLAAKEDRLTFAVEELLPEVMQAPYI